MILIGNIYFQTKRGNVSRKHQGWQCGSDNPFRSRPHDAEGNPVLEAERGSRK